MKITVLGSGSPESTPRRASSGFLVEIGEDRLLLDCGGGVVGNLLQAGLRPGDITHLVFSHLHSDHMIDYARLVHAAWDEGAPPLKVWGPKPIKTITNRLFGSDGALAHDIVARTEFPGSQQVWLARGGSLPRPWPAPDVREVQPGFSLAGNGWTLESREVPHAQPFLTCMALSILETNGERGGKKFCYSGDAGLCEALAELCADSDLLFHWCYRLRSDETHPAVADLSPSPDEIARMAAKSRVKSLWLTHFRTGMDTAAGHAEALSDLEAHFPYPGTCGILEDLQEFVL